MIKICTVCNKEFNTSSKNQLRCSSTCYGISKIKNRERPCSVCGTIFKPTKPKQTTCSHKCGSAYKKLALRICPTCNTEFDPNHSTQVYCSNTCKGKSIQNTHPTECLNCGKIFTSKIYTRKYCSKECYFSGAHIHRTKIELQLYSFLDNLEIEYIKQYYLKFTIPDAFIPNLNLCIYADGYYWHSPKINKGRDSKQNKTLKELGYNIIRLDEQKRGDLDLVPLENYLQLNKV